MSRPFRPALHLFLSILFFAACRSGTERPPSAAISVKDDLGRMVSLHHTPQRMISLAPNLTEMLYVLGLEDRIVGVTTYCDYPPEARNREKVGDTVAPNLEKIIALKPDLILVSTASQLEQFDARLRELGFPVYAVGADSLDGVLRSLDRLGDLTGAREIAKERSAALREQIESIQSRTRHLPPVRVFFIVQRQPLMVAGEKSFITDLIRRAGGQSITTDATREYAQYNIESVIAKAPQVIIMASSQARPQQLTDMAWPELDGTPAMRNHQVYSLNNDLLLRPGPRLVEGLRDLARVLHPEVFIERSGPPNNR